VVTFTLAGFNSLKREGLILTGSTTLPVSAELAIGSVEETLTVTGASPVVDIQNTRQQAVLTRGVLDAIPRARNAQNTGMLLPGMVADGSANGVTHDVGGSSGENQVVLSIHGSQNNDQTLQMDGFPVHVYDASTSMSGIHTRMRRCRNSISSSVRFRLRPAPWACASTWCPRKAATRSGLLFSPTAPPAR
jgi:hypothetical protein